MTLCEPSDEQKKQSAELSSSNCQEKPEYYNVKEAFVESERKFRTLVENVPDNIVRHDLQGRVLYINPQLEQTLGQCAEALLGKTIAACYPDGRFDDYQNEVENVIRTGQNSEIELTLPDNGEGWRYLYIRLIPEREADGKTLGVLAIGRDITELKRVELELQSNLRYFESMDRVNRAIQGSNDLDSMMRDVLDTVLSIFACDRAYLLYPCDPEASSWHVPMERHKPEYPGVHALGLAMPMDEGAAKVFRILLDAGRSVKFGPAGDYPLPMNVPEYFRIKSLMSVAVFPKMDKAWHFGIHQCSYPRVWTAAEERLLQEIGRRLADGLTSLLAHRDMRERERHFRTLAENSPDNIARYDLQGRMIYSNSRFDRTLGLFVQELSTNPLKGGNAGEPYQEYQSVVETVISTGQSNEMELSIPDNEGGLRYYHIRFVAERGSNGEIIGALAMGRNISQLRTVERLLLNLPNSIPGLLAAFRQRSDGSCYGAYASLKMREFFGLGFEDIKDDIGPLQTLLHPEDLPVLIQALKEAAHAMTSIRQEFRVNHPNKTEIWVEAHATPVLESDGSIIWYGYFADVTERHGLQNVLTERERKFRTLAENAPDTIIRYDRETRLLYMNPALERLLGQTSEQALGKRSDELFPHNEVMQRYQAMLEQVIATGEPAVFEIIDESPGNNRTLYSLVRFAAELDSQGRIVGAIAIGRDYTVQKRLEQELVRREQAFRTLVENSPDVIVRYDRDCRRIYINPAFEREIGITESSQTQGEICKHLIFSEEYRLRLKRVMELGEADTILLEWYEPNGRRVSYTMHAVAEYDEDGQVIGALAIGRNITELKATERYLEESRAQLRALTAKREKADEEERKRIGREIHDELGQLLSVMRLNVTTLDFRYGDSNPDLRDKVQKIVSILDRTIAKVRNLATRLRPVMLNFGIISALAWLVKDYAESTGIDCKLHVSVEDIPLDEDRAIVVFRIVQESLTNILRHSGAGRVVISLRNDAGVCEVDVQDNGKGFDPAAAGKRDSHGIIGMRERALMLNGTLDIVPAKTGGTVLKLRIPITATA